MIRKLMMAALCAMFWPLDHVCAQDSTNTWSIGLATSSAVSYTGINGYLLVEGKWNKHTLYAGPKLALSQSYLPANNIFGYDAGYSYQVVSRAHFVALVNLDYQVSYYRPLSTSPGNTPKNRIQECYFSIGLQYYPRIRGRFAIDLRLGQGLFRERYMNNVEKKVNVSYGNSSIARLGLSYQIFAR